MSGPNAAHEMVRASTAARATLRHDCGRQRILDLLDLEDTPHKAARAFAIERREAHVHTTFISGVRALFHNRLRLYSKV